jgi:hypothetical protein
VPESVGTMALKLSVDSQGWSNGLRSASDEQTKFAGRTKTANEDMKAGAQGASEKITGFFDKVKSGGSGAIFSELKSGLGDVVGQLGAGVGAAASFAGAIGAGLSLVVDKAREASREVNNLAKFGERIGANAQEAQVIRRTFELGGVADAEHTITRLAQHIGELRVDPTGGVAQALERIHLDPQRVAGLPTREAIEEIVVALGRVPNVFDRANISQQLFGKSFQEVQELVRRGATVFAQAEREVASFGVDAETVRTAREAESEWRKFGETTGAITGKIKEGFSSIGVVLSLQLAQAANGLTRLLGLQEPARSRPVTDRTATGVGGTWGEEVEQARTAQQEIARIVANGPRIRPVADVDVQVGRSLEQLSDRIRLDETARGSAERLGLVRVGATQQEIAAVRDLLQARDELVKKGATPDQLNRFDATARAAAASRRNQAAEGQLTTLQQEVRFAGLSAGLVQARIAAEQGVNERIAFRLDFMARERDLMNTLVQQRTSIIDSTLTETDRIGRTLGLIDQMRTRLGPNGLPLLNEQQANRAIGAAFANLNRQLGGPSSFAVNAPSANSVELANMVADLEIRQRHGVDDPERRIETLLQSILDGQAEGNRINDRWGEAAREILRQLPQTPANL